MKTKEIILVTYIEQNTIEGYVENEKDFDEWLKNHNKKRKEEGSLIENKHEFELKTIKELK